MAKRRISKTDGLAALDKADMATGVRYLLQCLSELHPGGTIELRVPPFGAVQLVSGMDHRRGTPPNVVEISPELFIELCLGKTTFDAHLNTRQLSLSGTRALELSSVFPLPNQALSV